MKRTAFAALAALAAVSISHAGTDFGTREDAEAIADALVAIIDADGIEAAVAAMHDPSQPFLASRLGVNLFKGSIQVADNREPEMVASDYAETADLNGLPIWPLVTAAADSKSEAVLLWYHYDTQERYEYHCLSRWGRRDEGLVMICR
jgi:hypothetical protein